MKRYKPSDEVDFVIVGSGSAGGILARELSRARFSVVVLEQGPWLTERDFVPHDAGAVTAGTRVRLNVDPRLQTGTSRAKESDPVKRSHWFDYGRCVGGGSVHFTANFWRFPEVEFRQASTRGVPDNSSVADWPISYSDLEPYYTKVEWEVGVSGLAGNPFEPPRSRPYPVPPLPIKSEGVLLERAAKKLGLHAWPAPMGILSQPYRGRSGCSGCGFCMGYGCEMRAKSSTMTSVIPEAVTTGRCEIRTHSYAFRVRLNDEGRAVGVMYFDKDRNPQLQRAKAVILSANGVETPKLLLLSRTKGHESGLANSSDQVGRNIMFNGGSWAGGMFEHDINAWKGHPVSRVVWDYFEPPSSAGLYGGGGFDFRRPSNPSDAAENAGWPGQPNWGRGWKEGLRDWFCRSMDAVGHTTSVPVASNRIDLDAALQDNWNLPVPRLTWSEHPEDVKLAEWFRLRGLDLLDAAGAVKISGSWGDTGGGGQHLLGTCRMGNDPRTSVVNPDHRAHDVRNLFIVDGSSFVTSGRGQPTMTIMALAFRAAERIEGLVTRHEL